MGKEKGRHAQETEKGKKSDQKYQEEGENEEDRGRVRKGNREEEVEGITHKKRGREVFSKGNTFVTEKRGNSWTRPQLTLIWQVEFCLLAAWVLVVQ
ncbi:hypothetical protein Pcinc_017968 [Petrolisthes cinctipes]|uniref:Uncharacterized protein n=1 Tax=Petrolisthes cinctipes TaxID=88211 RepID=A0AAE1KM67_PETCI|nr:hypothetical protein Pcinc_017968 [Petrolisthes cinctipes]